MNHICIPRPVPRVHTAALASVLLAAPSIGCATEDGESLDTRMTDAGGSAPPPPDAGPQPDDDPRPDAGPLPPRFSGLPLGCWVPRNSFCNPANNDGCEPDEACDLSEEPSGRPIIMCFPPPATEPLGAACNNSTGPFCQGGLRCMSGRCMDTCCSDAECTAPGERCVAMFEPHIGTLGVCDEDDGSTCSPPGGPCRRPSDCCSNICHIDHCH